MSMMLRIDSILLKMNKYLFFLHLYGYKKAPRDYPLRLFCVGLPGFEPGQTEPKPVVLPLQNLLCYHYTIVQTSCFLSKCVAKILSFYVIFQIFYVFFYYLLIEALRLSFKNTLARFLASAASIFTVISTS